MGIVEIAKAIATKAHEGQVRKMGDDKGKPYIIHPERVAAAMITEIGKTVAWLHDVLEDCPQYTAADFAQAGIPDEAIDAVVALTHRPEDSYLQYLIKVIEAGMVASDVKLADLEDNLKSCPPGSMRDKYELAKFILENY